MCSFYQAACVCYRASFIKAIQKKILSVSDFAPCRVVSQIAVKDKMIGFPFCEFGKTVVDPIIGILLQESFAEGEEVVIPCEEMDIGLEVKGAV